MSAQGKEAVTMEALPHALVLRILVMAPADARARCACVRRAWRGLLNNKAAWMALDLSPRAGVTCGARAADLLRGAAAKSGGALVSLDVSGLDALPAATLLEVVAANAHTLRELRVTTLLSNDRAEYAAGVGCMTRADAEALLAAAPNLITLHAAVRCPPYLAPPLLSVEPPLGTLRVTHLELSDTLDSLAMNLAFAIFARAAMPLGSVAFTVPPVQSCIAPLAEALRDSRTLTSLHCVADATHHPPESLAALLCELVAHPTLRQLQLTLREETLRGSAAALGALVAVVEANAPSLTTLHISNAILTDAELAPLLAALAHNTHLRTLDLSALSRVSEALAAQQLLPAVRAATSLRQLVLGEDDGDGGAPSLREALALLQARA